MWQLQGREDSFTTMAFTADSRYLVVGGSACQLDVWDLRNLAAWRPTFPYGVHQIAHVWLAPDGSEVVIAHFNSGWVGRYGLDGSKTGRTLHLRSRGGPPRSALSPDAEWGDAAPRITPDGSGVVGGLVPTVWRFESPPRPVWRAAVDDSFTEAHAYAIRPDQQVVAYAEFALQKGRSRIAVARIGSAQPPRELAVVRGRASHLEWAPKGDHLAALIEKCVCVWHADGRPAANYELPDDLHATDLAFHPSGRLLAVADNVGAVRLLNTATWAVVGAFEWGLGDARCVCFSPDGCLAAAGGYPGKIVVWDVDA